MLGTLKILYQGCFTKLKLTRFLCIFLVLASIGGSLIASADFTSSYFIGIKQGYVGHTQGCTVVSLQLLLQNSGTLKPEYQLSESMVSGADLSTYKVFDKACSGVINGTKDDKLGFIGGDTNNAWVLSGFIPTANALCDAEWSNVGSVKGTDSVSYGGITAITGLGNKDFKDMSDSELISAMKAIYNAGYYTVFCVYYGKASNGPSSYKASHATMMARVGDTTITLNDPATGNLINYFGATGNGGKPYQVRYLLCFKCEGHPANEVSGEAIIDEEDEKNAELLGLTSSIYYSENELSRSLSLSEENIAEILPGDILDLTQKEVASVAAWKNNADLGKLTVVDYLRRFVSFIGILLIVYASLLYMAYWFDRANSITDLDVLGKITLGHLHVAFVEKEANFSFGGSSGYTTVGHFHIISICVLCIFFGILLISGVIYKLILVVINVIQKVLGIR